MESQDNNLEDSWEADRTHETVPLHSGPEDPNTVTRALRSSHASLLSQNLGVGAKELSSLLFLKFFCL